MLIFPKTQKTPSSEPAARKISTIKNIFNVQESDFILNCEHSALRRDSNIIKQKQTLMSCNIRAICLRYDLIFNDVKLRICSSKCLNLSKRLC